MPRASSQNPKPQGSKLILLIGPPGGGKTALLMQFPKPGIADCDRNLDGPQKFILRSKKEGGLESATLDYRYDILDVSEKGGESIPKCYDRLLILVDEYGKDPEVLTPAIDSLQMVNEFIIRATMKEQNISTLEMRHWDLVKTKYIRLLASKLRDTGKTCIVTCHERPVQKADSKDMSTKIVTAYEPLVQSGIRDAFGGLFTDVWRCFSQPGLAGSVEYVLQTTATKFSPYLKNSMGMQSEIKCKSGESMYDKIKHYFQ